MKVVTSCILLLGTAVYVQTNAQSTSSPTQESNPRFSPSQTPQPPRDGFRKVDTVRHDAERRLNSDERAHLRQQLKDQYRRPVRSN